MALFRNNVVFFQRFHSKNAYQNTKLFLNSHYGSTGSKATLSTSGRALIVGGGILGLELAGALHKMEIEHLAIVQRTSFLGKPLLDAPAAGWLQRQMEADGIDMFVDDTVARVKGQTAHLQSGRTWDFDVFVQAIGITPVFPDTPGLETDRGIRIDGCCQTNLPNVYAAGDCTETRVSGSDRWQTTRIWLDCTRQGRTAGRNMARQDAVLPEQPFFNASIIYTALYAYIGEPHGEGGEVHVWQGGGGKQRRLPAEQVWAKAKNSANATVLADYRYWVGKMYGLTPGFKK